MSISLPTYKVDFLLRASQIIQIAPLPGEEAHEHLPLLRCL